MATLIIQPAVTSSCPCTLNSNLRTRTRGLLFHLPVKPSVWDSLRALTGGFVQTRASDVVQNPIGAPTRSSQGLKEKYDKAMRRNDVKAIVVTGNGSIFSGGFDINVLQEVQQTGNLSHLGRVSVDLMINTIEEAKKPSVAAIQGLALGGGLELAMSCHVRISTPKAQLGFPKLQFGIIPGFGDGESKTGVSGQKGHKILAPRLLKITLVDAHLAGKDKFHGGQFSWVTESGRQERHVVATVGKFSVIWNFRQVKNNDHVCYKGQNGLKSCYCYKIVPKDVSIVDSKFMHDKFAITNSLEAPLVVATPKKVISFSIAS